MPRKKEKTGTNFIEKRNDRPAGVRVHEPGTHPDEMSETDGQELKRLEQSEEARKSNAWGSKKGQPKGRRHKLATFGIPKDIVDGAVDPAYGKCLKYAASYRKHRARELCVAHGYVSAGASALLATASLALASSRYLYERVATTGETDLLMKAHKLADSARQNELAAWELAAREGAARRKAADAAGNLPWLQAGHEGAGRPRKATKAQEEASLIRGLPEPGSPELEGWIASTVDDKKALREVVDVGHVEEAEGAGAEGLGGHGSDDGEAGGETEAEGDEELP